MKRIGVGLAGLFFLVAAGCAAKYQTVRVPPRIDLTEHDLIAVVEFDSSTDGKLGPLATRRFTESARRDQGLVRMMSVIAKSDRRDSVAFKELGESHGARTVLVEAPSDSGSATYPGVRLAFFVIAILRQQLGG